MFYILDEFVLLLLGNYNIRNLNWSKISSSLKRMFILSRECDLVAGRCAIMLWVF